MVRLLLRASDLYPDCGGLTRTAAPVQPPDWYSLTGKRRGAVILLV